MKPRPIEMDAGDASIAPLDEESSRRAYVSGLTALLALAGTGPSFLPAVDATEDFEPCLTSATF